MPVMRTAVTPITAEQARRTGEDFIAEHLGDQVGAGLPWHVVSPLQSAWIVPLVLTSPGIGPVGIVGVIVVDDGFGHITAWTGIDEIKANIKHLATERQTELEQAFQQTILNTQERP